MKKMLKCAKGFTLIELMVVIIIVGILASISVPIYKKYVTRALSTEGQALVGAVGAAAKVYYSEHGSMPATYTSTAGTPDTILNVDASQNKYFLVFTFTPGTGAGYTVTTAGTGDAAAITVSLIQANAGVPTLTVTGL